MPARNGRQLAQTRGHLATRFATKDESALAPNRQTTKVTLDVAFVNRQARIFGEQDQLLILVQRVPNRFANHTLGLHLVIARQLTEPRLESLQQWIGVGKSG